MLVRYPLLAAVTRDAQMKRMLNLRTLAGDLTAAGATLVVGSIYADHLRPGVQEPNMGPLQWLGVGLGAGLALIGAGLISSDRIKGRAASLLRRARGWLAADWPLLLAIVLTLLVAALALNLRLNRIAAALPYPGHIDEPHLSDRAGQVLKTGKLELRFNYPHTPVYLVLAGLVVGYVDAAMHMEVYNTESIGSLSFPYFSTPRVIWPAKALFAALSVGAMVLMGLVGFRAFGRQGLLWLVPLVILFSSTYFYYSHQYLNVDLVGAFFAAALYFCLFQYLDRDTILHKSILPGAFCALTLTSKYNLLWIVVPPLLVILLYCKKNRLGKILVFLLAVVVGSLLLMPTLLTNFSTFFDHIAGSMYHYSRGHVGHEGQPGVSQLVHYLNTIVGAYGLPTLLPAILGLVVAFWKNWKGTLILVSFPTLLLLFMSAQRARFERNIVSTHLFYGLFVAVGILFAYDLLNQLLERYAPLKRAPGWRRLAILLALAGLVAWLLPVRQVLAWTEAQPDSRNLATAWILDNVPQGSTLLIAEELRMDTTPLEADYRVAVEPLAQLSDANLYRLAWKMGDPHILMPVYGDSSSASSPDGARTLGGMQVLVDFAGHEVQVDYREPVPHGNPRFSIGLLELAPEERARLESRVELDVANLEGRKRVTADGTLRLPWNTTLRSPPVLLRKGDYEVVLVTKGTEIAGENAQFRVTFGEENLVGEFYSQENFQETTLAFEVIEDQEASLILAFVNDGAERNDQGEIIANRDAWIQSILLQRVNELR